MLDEKESNELIKKLTNVFSYQMRDLVDSLSFSMGKESSSEMRTLRCSIEHQVDCYLTARLEVDKLSSDPTLSDKEKAEMINGVML